MGADTDPISEIYFRLGGSPVLLPARKGEKRPYGSMWQTTTWEQTQEAAYQSELRGGHNVGVLLGSPSHLRALNDEYHLCTIDVDSEDGHMELEALNPRLAGSLQSKGSRGRQYWLFVLKDSYPKLSKLCLADESGRANKAEPWGEWRATGGQTIIHGLHPSGCLYRFLNDNRVGLFDFAEIRWPDGLSLPWVETESALERLIRLHGEPVVSSKNGLALNPPFFVGKYELERDVLYEPSESRFYEYEQGLGVWDEKTEASVRWAFSEDLGEVAAQLKAPSILTKRNNGALQGLVDLLKGLAERRDVFSDERDIVHVANGMLNLGAKPPTLVDFSPQFYSRNRIPFPFDEEATCPRFENELVGNWPSHDRLTMRKWAGMALLGRNIGQKIMILTGTAGGGKSTFANVIREIIGTQNVFGLRTHLLGQRFETFNYLGKTLLIGSDVHPNFLSLYSANELKSLVGGDVIPAEKKNGESVSLIGNFNVIITSNDRLKVVMHRDPDAWRRRLIIINCAFPKPERPDPQFLKKLIQSEASGILNWMIQGAVDLLEDFYSTGKFSLSAEQQTRVDGLLAESDSVRQFVQNAIAPTDGTDDVTKEELGEGYVDYCELRGWAPLPNGQVRAALGDILLEVHRKSERNDIIRDGKAKRGYKGIRILDLE